MEQEILQLEEQVKLLKSWKETFSSERFKFPLDFETQTIIDRENIVATGKTYEINSVILNDLIGVGVIVGIANNPKRKVIIATLPLNQFTVDAVTNIITNINGTHALKNGDIVYFTTSGTLPAPLSEVLTYYVISSTNTTFKVSLTLGGSEVDITTAGSGIHYYSKL